MKHIFGLLLLLIAQLSFGQLHNIEIIGEIHDPEANEAVAYVHIVNLRTNQGEVSNSEGRFWIDMQKTDTLLFSAIGFEKYYFTLKEQVTTNKLVVTIELKHSTLELETVKVFAFKDEYALKRALLDVNAPIEPEKKAFEIPGIKMSKITRPEGGIRVGGPLSAIGNLFSKEVKEYKKLEEVSQEYDYQKLIKAKYNEHIVMRITGLKEDDVEDFMNFCKLEDSFISRSSEYELTVVIQQCLTDYKSNSLDSLQNKNLPEG